jgi:hypothetical protein
MPITSNFLFKFENFDPCDGKPSEIHDKAHDVLKKGHEKANRCTKIEDPG